MDTLKNLRGEEHIVELTGEVFSSQDTAYLTVELQRRGDNILVVMNHSKEVVDEVLKGMDPDDSGYMFFASELELDPINNCMVPLHKKATLSEIDELTRRKVPLDKLPIIRMTDPVRRWHNFPRNSIVAIERPNGKASVYFRRVA